MFRKIIQFFKEAIKELGNVTWPTRREVLNLSLGVVIISLLFALFAGGVDLGLTKGLQQLITWRAQYVAKHINLQNSQMQVQPEGIQVDTNATK